MPTLPLRLIVFDCDGTLVDSQHMIVAAMAGAWALAGRDDAPPVGAVRRVIGLPLVEAIARLAPELDGEGHRALAAGYKEAFFELRENGADDEPLFPGAAEAIAALAEGGAVLGVATGKGRAGLDYTLARHGLAGHFVTLQTSDVARGKPDPEMLHRAMAETGAAAADTVMIGDTTFDILMAKNAGVAAIGVEWGYHEAAELEAAGAACIVGGFAALGPAIEALLKPTGG